MVPAQRVVPKVYHRFLTSVESYREYIRYWNTKVRDISGPHSNKVDAVGGAYAK